MAKILIIEDDDEIALIEKDYLEMSGYEVLVKTDGNQIMELLSKETVDLMILDLMLPGIGGYEICKMVREQYEIPVLMVTAKTETVDKIRGLGLGADDYIAKPFDPAELVARVGAHLKRFDRLTHYANESEEDGNTVSEKVIKISDVKIMTKSWKVFKGEDEIKFPHREFELLKFLAINPNIVFSKEALFEKIWGYDYVGDSATVTVHVNRIREKIEDDPKNPQIIETIWGAGYRLNL
ncbi:MAG: response regulator transcription factor [Lachnospiraceae bacterium]|nr:response regulator transcription factor [Lachnospiraceae bacterium]